MESPFSSKDFIFTLLLILYFFLILVIIMAELFSLQTMFGVNKLFLNFYDDYFEKELLSPKKEVINFVPIKYSKVKNVIFKGDKVTFKFGFFMLDVKNMYITESKRKRLMKLLEKNNVSYEHLF